MLTYDYCYTIIHHFKMAQGLLAYKYCLTGWRDKGAKMLPDVWNEHKSKLNYLCGQVEQTAAGKMHTQFWVEFKERKRPSAVKKLFPADQYHHERIRGTDAENNKYCTKESTRIDGPWTFGETLHSRNKAQKEAEEVTDKVADGASEKQLWQEHPVYMVRSHTGIRRMIEVIQAEVVKPKFTLNEFTWQAITDWSTSHVFQGDSGIGKTSFAIAHFETPFFCRDLDNLKNFSPTTHDGIVFDDLADALSEVNDDVMVHLLDIDHPSQIKCRYNNATIPSGTRKIFTTNKDAALVFGRTPQIDRRVTIHRLVGKQRKTNTVPVDLTVDHPPENKFSAEEEKRLDNGLTAPLPLSLHSSEDDRALLRDTPTTSEEAEKFADSCIGIGSDDATYETDWEDESDKN